MDSTRSFIIKKKIIGWQIPVLYEERSTLGGVVMVTQSMC